MDGVRWGRRSMGALALGVTLSVAARAEVAYQVSFNDPGAMYSAYYDEIRSNVLSAGSEWATYLATPFSVSLQVQVNFADIDEASGASVTNAYVGMRNGIATFEQGAISKVESGIDPNGAAPDIDITIGVDGYLQNALWFDPAPGLQTAAVPTDKTDARSVFLHEFGHAFVFNGWRDGQTGALPDGYQSTFDSLVTLGAGALYFSGTQASALNGGPVALTNDRYGHVGNASPGAGSDLVPDLMNGVSFVMGSRYHVSMLDVAILRDTGVSIATASNAPNELPVASVPEPSQWVMMAGGLLGLASARRRERRAS
jgi:PEP-CTERM motif